MTELSVDEVLQIVAEHLRDQGDPRNWYINDTPENMAKIWKRPPCPVQFRDAQPVAEKSVTVAPSDGNLPPVKTTRMPLSYPLGGNAEKVERPSVPQALLTPKPKLSGLGGDTGHDKLMGDA